MMGADESAALAADIAGHGQREPIWLHADGRVIDGRNRWLACEVALVEPVTRTYEGADDELVRFVLSLNLHRRHLTTSQRAMVASRVADMEPGPNRDTGNIAGVSQGEAAEMLAVSERSVRTARTVQDKGVPELVAAVDAGELSVAKAAAIATSPDWLQREAVRAIKDATPTDLLTMSASQRANRELGTRGGTAHVSHNSGENEWYTPPEYLDAARAVMGGIDLDPASSDLANERVKAETYYTAADDGLTQEWVGRVWMNPPYAQPLIEQFCTKLGDEYRAASVTDAIVLVNNGTETAWFQGLAAHASAICFPKGRVQFLSPSNERAQPLQGQAVLYLGPQPEVFVATFTRFGLVTFNG
jgi:ParB family chromosome partitioning protein